jgi:hypothetical protein
MQRRARWFDTAIDARRKLRQRRSMEGKVTAEPAEKGTRIDGRRERGRSSHKRIVAAMMDLIEGGDLMPSAARVAEEVCGRPSRSDRGHRSPRNGRHLPHQSTLPRCHGD